MEIGAAMGAAYAAISPYKKPVRTILLFSIASLCFMDLQFLVKVLPGWETVIYGVSRIAFGFFYSIAILAQSVFHYYFNKDSDKSLIHVWYSVSYLG